MTLSKAHLILHSRMSGSRWVITPSWLSWLWRCFLYSSSVYSWHLFLISYASVRSIPFLSFDRARLCLKCSLGISNFLDEISSLPILLFSSISLHWGLACCNSWGLKELDTTELLNWTELNWVLLKESLCLPAPSALIYWYFTETLLMWWNGVGEKHLIFI